MDSDKRRSRSGPALVLVIVLLLPVLYVLSIGPAALVIQATGQNDELIAVVEVVYYPVMWLQEHTPLADPIGWYVELWEDL